MDIVIFIAGTICGAAATFFIFFSINKNKEQIAKRINEEKEQEKEKELELIINKAKEAFREISDKTADNIINTNKSIMEREQYNAKETFQKDKYIIKETLEKEQSIIKQSLEKEKSLINENLNNVSSTMKEKLNEVYEYMQSLKEKNENQFGELKQAIETSSKETKTLSETTQQLKEALTNTRTRGQWGERIAEDIIKILGLIEGKHYLKQKQIEEVGNRQKPDFTFLLPQGRTVNMDVKFSLDNYLRFTETNDEQQKNEYKKLFIKDVNKTILDISKKEYIGQNTLDYLIVFIPSEQVYSFINETDINILENALKERVILCSPFTLYAVLSIIKQSIENFKVGEKIIETLNIIGGFRKEWDKFKSQFDKVGDRLAKTQKEFDTLTSTRERALERELKKIDNIDVANNISKEETKTL